MRSVAATRVGAGARQLAGWRHELRGSRPLRCGLLFCHRCLLSGHRVPPDGGLASLSARATIDFAGGAAASPAR